MVKARKVEGAIVMDINARLMWFSMVKRDMTLTLSMSVCLCGCRKRGERTLFIRCLHQLGVK
jgi:hypothetical protein